MGLVYIYGLTANDIAQELPGIDSSQIGPNTEPISTANLSTFIEDGSAKINGVAIKSGITPSATMDDIAQAALREAVKAYATSKALLMLGQTGIVYEQAYQRFLLVYNEYSTRPQQLGSAFADSYVTAQDTDDKGDIYPFVDSEGSVW